MTSRFAENALIIEVDSRIYGVNVIHKSCYWLLDKFCVDISMKDEISFIVTLTGKETPIVEPDIEILSNVFKNHLVDFKTREIISEETKTVRELLIAKAFANSDDFDEKPFGDLQDTVGVDLSEYEK